MAIQALIAGAEVSAASGGLILNAPASPQRSDIWIAVIHVSDRNSISMSGEWTPIFQANGGGTTSRLAVFWHRYAGYTPNLIVLHTGGQSPVGGISAFRGCWAVGSPVDVVGLGRSGVDSSIEISGLSPSEANCLLVVCDGAGDNNRRSVPAGFVPCFESIGGGIQNCYTTNAGNPDGSVACHVKTHTSGPTGDFIDTMTAADPWASVMFALKPAPVAGGILTKEVRWKTVTVQRLRPWDVMVAENWVWDVTTTVGFFGVSVETQLICSLRVRELEIG